MVVAVRGLWFAAVLFAASASAGGIALAQDTTLQISIQNGHFQPSELRAPVNVPIVIVIKNNDAKPAEFESSSLKVEKVIPAKGQVSVRIRPLGPGRYDFYDDFNASNRGTLVIQ
jgi:hypothetical protein